MRGSPSRPATCCWRSQSSIAESASCCATGDAKFCRGFDEVFRAEGAEVVLTPVQAPTANAYAERWVRPVRTECLDWLLTVGRGQLEQVLQVYVGHDNRHRPHRALGLQAPDQSLDLTLAPQDQRAQVRRRDLLGGLVHEYQRAA